MSQTAPGVVVIEMGNQDGTTLVNLDDPAREVTRAPGATPTRAPRKQRRAHQDKQRHEAHQDKEIEHGEG